jgi:hypothetical protein
MGGFQNRSWREDEWNLLNVSAGKLISIASNLERLFIRPNKN